MSYIIGDIELDTEQLELRQSGKVLAVQKKVFELILFLINNRDRALSKDEIQSAVWPGTIVSETALTRAILKARRALNDDAQEQALIKTIHGVGYRFVGEVIAGKLDSAPLLVDSEWKAERRNDLLKTLTAYGAIAWLGNQMAAMVWEAFEFDKVMLQYLLAFSLAALPLVLAFTWWFRFTPQGLRRRDEKQMARTKASSFGFYSFVFGALLIGLSATVYWGQRERPVLENSVMRIAVLPLQNNTGISEHDWTGLGLMSLLNQQISGARMATVPVKKVIDLVGDSSDELSVTDSILDKFQKVQGSQTLVLPELSVRDDKLLLKLVVYRDGSSQSVQAHGDFMPTELAQMAGRDLVTLLHPQRASGRYQAGISTDPFVNELYSRGMYQELSGNLEQARNLFKTASVQDPEFFEASYEYAITTRYLGHFDEAEPLLDTLFLDAENRGNAKQLVMLCNALGVLYDLKGNLNKAELIYQRGIQIAKDEALHEEGANLLFNYAIIEKNRGNLSSARNLLGQAITGYQKDDISVSGSVYITLGNVAVNEGDLREAGDNYEKARKHFIEQQSLSGEAIALSNLSWLAQQEKRFDESLAFLDQSIDIRRRTSDKVGLIKGLVRQADLQYAMGEFDACAQTTAQILDNQHVLEENDLHATALAFKAMLAYEKREFAQAIKDMLQVIKIRISRQDLSGQLRMQNLLATVYMKQKEYAQAESLLTSTLEDARTRNMASIEASALLHMAQIVRSRDGLEAGAQSFSDLLTTLRSRSDPRMERTVAIEYAQILMEQNNLGAASGLLASLTNADPDRALLLAQAEFAFKNDLQANAIKLMQEAKSLSRQRWSVANEERLTEYTR